MNWDVDDRCPVNVYSIENGVRRITPAIALVRRENEPSFGWEHIVLWGSYVVKQEGGFVCSADARSAAEHWLREIQAGKVDAPWLAADVRDQLQLRLERLRVRQGG